eukprot:tig00020538_g10320.t1
MAVPSAAPVSRCASCGKDIPSANMVVHAVHCARIATSKTSRCHACGCALEGDMDSHKRELVGRLSREFWSNVYGIISKVNNNTAFDTNAALASLNESLLALEKHEWKLLINQPASPADSQSQTSFVPHTFDNFGDTIIHVVIRRLKNQDLVVEIVSRLLQHDPSLVSSCNNSGDTPLHLACSLASNEKLVSLLLAQPNIDVNVKNKLHDTALHLSSRRRYIRVSKMLVDAGARWRVGES